ncbi:hypothetical protein [Paenibacillus sp. NEAU-GSW1]|uniref:hypothetical protein n=1 Tax=Paenibacillus sp. NEAU-GSW1 TaxID=2682486 RepID=UPI0012E2BB28|nr:hypothetical protein [Paenibacillus sp. NEAU-GSW1]MUT66663.1 hypothetical protein [Paenibacillus sp. NEAU-GSW1]
MISTTAIEQRWIDDHLELLHYAKQIGDIEWQNEIIALLKNKEQHTKQLALMLKADQLWRQFDRINSKMLELYNQLRTSNDEREIEALKEEVWALKLQRIDLSKQLKEEIGQ